MPDRILLSPHGSGLRAGYASFAAHRGRPSSRTCVVSRRRGRDGSRCARPSAGSSGAGRNGPSMAVGHRIPLGAKCPRYDADCGPARRSTGASSCTAARRIAGDRPLRAVDALEISTGAGSGGGSGGNAPRGSIAPCSGGRGPNKRPLERRTRKRPKELVGGPLVDAHRLRTSPESLRSAQVPRSPALRPSNPVPGTVPRIAPRCGLAVRTCPFGQDEMYRPGHRAHNGLIHELRPNRRRLIPELPPDVDEMWMARTATRVQHPSTFEEA